MQKTLNSTDLWVRSSKKTAIQAQDTAWNIQEKQQRVFTRELFDRNCGLNSPNVMATMMHNPDFISHHALEESATRCCLSVWLAREASGGTQMPHLYQQHLELSHCSAVARHKACSLPSGVVWTGHLQKKQKNVVQGTICISIPSPASASKEKTQPMSPEFCTSTIFCDKRNFLNHIYPTCIFQMPEDHKHRWC